MPWPDTIAFSEPLREVRLASFTPPSLEQELERVWKTKVQESYEKGKQDGEKLLSEQLVRQRAELLEIQNGVLDSLRQSIPQLLAHAEKGLVHLALQTAGKLVDQIAITPEMVEAAIQECLAQVEAGFEVRVLLHPEDLALLQKINSPLLLPNGRLDPLQFQSSAEVTRGGCLLQTPFGLIDNRRETKLELLTLALQ